MVEKKLDNKIAVPNILSFLTYQDWNQQIVGMDQFKKEDLPDNIPALYYSYHIMVGLRYYFHWYYGTCWLLIMEKKTVFDKAPALGHYVLGSISLISQILRAGMLPN